LRGGVRQGQDARTDLPVLGIDKDSRKRARLVEGSKARWLGDGARHTFCSAWLAKHKSVDRLREISGHLDTKSLFRHYSLRHEKRTRIGTFGKRQTCGVFLSLISDTSAQRLSAYNILERNLSSKRRDRFAESVVFYIPLRIDDGQALVPANEPRCIRKIQVVRRFGGHLDDDFIEYLRQLQLKYIKRCGLTFTPPPPAP
jgi:hypothetical protein